MPEFEDVVDYLAEMLPLEDYVQKEQVTYLGKNWDDAYMEMLHGMKISQKLSQDSKARLRIVYTPLNGAGAKPVLRVLNENGFRRVFMVSEQEKPDGNFPTLRGAESGTGGQFCSCEEICKSSGRRCYHCNGSGFRSVGCCGAGR